MSFKGKAATILAAIAGVLMFAGSAQANLLGNGSFETPDASSMDISGAGAPWGFFNSNFTTSNLNGPPVFFINPGARDGVQVLKQFGADAGSFQDVAISEGVVYEASAWAINWTGDQWSQLGILQLFWLDAIDGNQIGDPIEAFCDADGNQACVLTPQIGDDPSQWTQVAVSGLAPAGAAAARIQLLHIDIGGGGALFWDDAVVQAVPIPAVAFMFPAGLIAGLGWMRRRRTS